MVSEAKGKVQDQQGGGNENAQNINMDSFVMCFREKSMCLDKEDVVQVKDAFKWAVQRLVGKELGASVLTNVSVTVASVGKQRC